MSAQELFPTRKIVAETIEYPAFVTVPGIVNTHFHPRDTDAEGDGRAEMLIPRAAEVYDTVLCMGNTNPPLITQQRAYHKAVQWRALVPPDNELKLKIGGLMTETTDPDHVIIGYDQPESTDRAMIAAPVHSMISPK